MAIEFKKTAFKGGLNPFWRIEVKMLPGGYDCSQTIPTGEVVKRGALVAANFDTLTAAIVKVGKVIDGGTTTKPRVSKGNYFYAGDTVMKVGENDVGVTVKSVDRSNPDYDVVEFSAAITGLAKDDFIVEAVKDGGGSTYSQAHEANTILGADFEAGKSGINTLDVAYSAVVLKDVCPLFPTEWLTGGAFLATNHQLMFIKQ